MSEGTKILERLICNADKTVKFESMVELASKQQASEFAQQNKIGSDRLIGVKQVKPRSEFMQYTYGL